MDMNTILIRLQNGEDINSIAQELTNALNAASAEYERQKEMEEGQRYLDEIANDMGLLLLEYMRVSAPDLVGDVSEEEAGAIMSDALKGTIETLRLASNFITKAKDTCAHTCHTTKEALHNFLLS